MNILWVNNSSSPYGGTLWATADGIKAFPDARHSVLTFGGDFSEDARRILGMNTDTYRSVSVARAAKDSQADLIIYQNTSASNMPVRQPDNTCSIYYQHSAYPGPLPGSKCSIHLCVSQYLAGLMGMPEHSVLYQPVSVPPEVPETRMVSQGLRICTPNPKKWQQQDILPYLSALGEHTLSLVGAPEGLTEHPCASGTYPPSLDARSLLHTHGFLFYTSKLPETYGRTVCEAQRAGCIPIVSRRGGFVEQIDNEDGPDYGFLIDTPESLSEALRAYRENPEFWSEHVKKRGDERGSLQAFREGILRRLG